MNIKNTLINGLALMYGVAKVIHESVSDLNKHPFGIDGLKEEIYHQLKHKADNMTSLDYYKAVFKVTNEYVKTHHHCTNYEDKSKAIKIFAKRYVTSLSQQKNIVPKDELQKLYNSLPNTKTTPARLSDDEIIAQSQANGDSELETLKKLFSNDKEFQSILDGIDTNNKLNKQSHHNMMAYERG